MKRTILLSSLLALGLAAGPASAKTKLYWFIPDGMRADPRDFDVYRFAEEGLYPNIKKMMEQGSYGYSVPTYPSHTPTNFATLLTGSYPETHGIADGPMRVEGNPLQKPSVTGFSSTAKKVRPVWKEFEENGLKVAIVSVPGSTPPEISDGVVVRGRWANWGADFFALNFETRQDASQRAKRGLGVRLFYAGPELTKYVPVTPAEGWKGPKSYSPPLEIKLLGYGATMYALVTDPTNDKTVNYSDVSLSFDKKKVFAKLKEANAWSDWTPVTLQWGERPVETQVKVGLIKTTPSGFVRLRLLYDLLNPTLVQPGDLAEDIRRNVGPMVDFPDNWPAQLNIYPEDKAVFLTEAKLALDWHRRLAGYLLREQKSDVVIQDTYVPNQTLESRWWMPMLDRDSARYAASTPEEREAAWKDVHEIYKGLDAILGEAMKNAGPDTLIVLSSDHGVIPLNKQVLLNNLLAREGLLKFTVSPETGEPVVDWANSKAIHLKMHGVYLHPGGLAGPWQRGKGPDYAKLRDRVAKLVLELKDGDKPAVLQAVPWDQAEKLRLPKDRVADLILVVNPGYGLSEEMSEDLKVFKEPLEGGYKQALIADAQPGLWTPFIVMGPGVKAGHRIKEPIRNADQAPTLLTLMGQPVPAHMQGRVIDEIAAK